MTDAMLLVGDSRANPNLYHATGFLVGDPFIYLQANGNRLLVIGEMEKSRAQAESTATEVRTYADYGYRDVLRETGNRSVAFNTVIARVIQEGHLNTVEVEPTFPVAIADHLRGEGIEINVDPDLMSLQRRAKSEAEIAAIEEAQRATEKVMSQSIDMVRRSTVRDGVLYLDGAVLTSERLRNTIEVTLLQEGMDSAESPIMAAGPRSAQPHWLGSGEIRARQPIIFDIFPRGKSSRYYADMTRTIVKGQPSEELQAMYDATLRALEAALVMIRPGVNGREVHAAVESVFEEAGFSGDGPGPRFIHGTGHGVGLDIHEAPGLGLAGQDLIVGDVVTVEPGLYDESIGGVRIEDMVVVTGDGYRNLTQFPYVFEV